MKAALYTLGCKVNQYETTAMQELLQGAGYEIVSFEERADAYIINTCTVTNVADKKSRNMIRRAARQGGVVCVCGCMPQKDAERVLAIPGVRAVVGTAQRRNIVDILARCMGGEVVNAVADVAEEAEYEDLSVATSGELTRGYIKIQDGCDSFCSYCIIPHVRGRVRSRSTAQVAAEARRLAGGGVKEIVLTGINIASFGADSGERLVDLLRAVNETPGLLRVRMGSLSPLLLTEEFLRELVALEKLCPHFHISLQSGSNGVLRRMNRKYSAEEYAERVALARQFYDRPAITTDVITGFPGETEQEFGETRDFVEQTGFARLHVFPYSEREGTPAARMAGRVPPAVRRERANELIRLGKLSETAYIRQFLGTVQHVLLEQPADETAMEGYTDRYLRVHMPGRQGQCVKALLIRANCDTIIGELSE